MKTDYTDKIKLFEQDEELNKLKQLAKERLSEKRYLHTVAVAERGVLLAEIHGGDAFKAYKAGLLHDICKDMHFLKQEEVIVKYYPTFWKEKKVWANSMALWHSKAGAVFVRHELNETDEEIINAVEYHTSAREGMSLTEQLVYLADLTSEDRSYPDIDVMRRLSEEDIDGAMLYALTYIIGDLTEKEEPISIETVTAYNQYVIKCRPTFLVDPQKR